MYEIISTLEFLKELKERLEEEVFDGGDIAIWIEEIDERIQDLENLINDTQTP